MVRVRVVVVRVVRVVRVVVRVVGTRVVVRVVGTRVEVRVVVGRGFNVVVGVDSAVVVANVVTDVASVVMVLIFCS